MSQSTSESKLQLWRQRFEQFNQSQLTVEQFCNSIDCSAATFYYWKQKLGRVGQANTLKAQYESAGQAGSFAALKTIRQLLFRFSFEAARATRLALAGQWSCGLKTALRSRFRLMHLQQVNIILRHVQRVAG